MKPRCVFLDRDGVINAAPPPGEYITRWADFHLMPGIVDWIRLIRALGFLVIVATNQRAVALGRITLAGLEEIHRRMAELLAEAGAPLDDVFCCPHAEGECDCRKPQTGLIRAAAGKWGIDLAGSFLIGDSWRDRETARNAGLTFIEASGGHIRRVITPPTDPRE
jgi:histidinol-phosphate phosphatase family protein